MSENSLSPETNKNKKRSLLMVTATFLYLVAVSIIILVVWSVWQARLQTIAENKGATTNMARALSQHAEDTIRAADNILGAVVAQMENTGTAQLANNPLNRYLGNTAAEQPMLAGLFVYDTKGVPFASSQPLLVAHVNVADRAYFLHHKNDPDHGAYVGEPIQSRSTGEWILTVSRRINDAEGNFAGVALATIRVDYFREFYNEFDIGNAGTIFLATEQGMLLVRRAQSEVRSGVDISKGPVFNMYKNSGPIGTAMLTSNIDGTERLYSYRRLEDHPLLVAVALAKEDILQTWQIQTSRMAVTTTLLLLILILVGYRMIVLINAKEAIEYELRDAHDKLGVLNNELETLASEDALTGLPNRRKFDTTLAIEFARAARNETPLALIMIDVDRFKQFNDLYGHPIGDECLRRIGQVLLTQGPNRATDLPARYGGEEMVILLPETDHEGAMAVAERIRRAIRGMAITHKANPDGIVTISAGVATCVPTRECHPNQLLKKADEALYEAKAGGRDRVCCAAG